MLASTKDKTRQDKSTCRKPTGIGIPWFRRGHAKARRRGKWRYFSALWFSSKFTTFHLTSYLFYLFLSFRTSSKLLHISCIGILCVERV